MKKIRWQLLIIFLTGLVVGVLLLGEQQGGSPFQILAPEPAKGGVYTEALIGSLQRLNPLLDTYNSVDRDIDRLVYSGLIRFDERGLPIADLAESWGVSQDGTIYNVTLRKDLKWQDGQPLTSADVLFTTGLLRKGGDSIPADLQDFWTNVEVSALGDIGLQFKLKEPFAPFLDYISFGVLPKHLLQNMTYAQIVDAPFNIQPVGSGPYKFEKLIVEENQIKGVVLSAFDGYYGKRPFISQIAFRYYPDGNSAFLAYKEGTAQGISTVTSDILTQVLAEPDLAIYTGRKPMLTMVLLNLKNPDVPFLQDAAVRQALLTGINRQRMVDQLLKGQGILADGPIFPGTWAYYDGLQRVEYDGQAANNMLRDAGYVIQSSDSVIRAKDKQALKITLTYPDDDSHKAIAEGIKSDWAKIGVGVELDPLSYDKILSTKLDQRSYQAALVDLNLSQYPDPDPYPFWDQATASGGQNYSQWENRVASEYLEQARTSLDITERTRLYHNFQVIFSQELPSLPLWYPVETYAIDRSIQGVSIGPLLDPSDRFATVTNWFLVAKKIQMTATP